MSASIKQFIRFFLLTGMTLSVLAIWQTESLTQALLNVRSRYKWVILIGVFAAAFAVQAWLFLKPALLDAMFEKLAGILRGRVLSKLTGVVLLAAGLPLLWVARFPDLLDVHVAIGVTLFAVWWIILFQAFGLRLLSGLDWGAALLAALLAGGLLSQVYNIFQPVSRYPFSLGWSEGSRYFYASLPFSRSLYGEAMPLSVMHGTRYFMQSLPFLINGLPLWADRLWQALLWVGMTGLTAWLAVRRTIGISRGMKWLFGGWLFLFYFQGAVYYHLLVSVILVLAGISSRHPWRSLIAVLAASFWAGMSRLNWFPVPAMLAIMLYLLEEPFSRSGNVIRYLVKPAVWAVCGVTAALLGQAFYISISGNSDLAAFGSSLTSDLLWYRLWPNETYAIGVIPALALASLPAVILLAQSLRGRLHDLHPLRLLGLGAMLLVLLAGGLVVSTKIGGGGDLHNMDAFLAMLGLIVVALVGGQVETETSQRTPFASPGWILLLFLVAIPAGWAFLKMTEPARYEPAQAERDLAQLRAVTQEYSRSGDVLFMYERHLLTFGMIPGIPMVRDYEVVTLMEMAISGNQPYLDKFHQDVDSHRFAAIVMRRINLRVTDGDFAEENNAWNRQVAYQVYCEYEPVLTLESSNVQVLVPREERDCPKLPKDSGQP